MRKQWIGTFLLLAGAVTGPAANRAVAQAQQWDISGTGSINAPTPFGPSRPDGAAIYGTAEFMFIHQSRSIGHQIVAQRGYVDSDGSLTGFPGTFVGSKATALSTDSLGRETFTPGFRVGLGYRMEDGTSLSFNYTHLVSAKYNASAGQIPQSLNPGSNLADSFLFQPVFNFSNQFSGPPNKIATLDPQTRTVVVSGSGNSPFGIWNGANTVDTTFIQRFDNYDITARMPVLETEYAKTYVLAGGRLSSIWERYGMRTVSSDNTGISTPIDAAEYTNIMSQRMYGPFIGTGNEVWLGNRFSLSADITAAALLDIVKERAKYLLGDDSTQSKRGAMHYTIVPNVNASVNLWWYPIEAVELRVGYNFWSFFNSLYMQQPVGWNAGAIDPSYKNLPVRFFHGIDVGIGISF
jgi:hypothetical protein